MESAFLEQGGIGTSCIDNVNSCLVYVGGLGGDLGGEVIIRCKSFRVFIRLHRGLEIWGEKGTLDNLSHIYSVLSSQRMFCSGSSVSCTE